MPHGFESKRGAVVARDVMTSPVISAPSTMSVAEAAQLMLNHHLGALPVVDASGTVVGMVSDGDLLGRRPEDDRREWWLNLLARGTGSVDLPPQRLTRPISEVMSAPVISVSPSTTLDVVVELLQLHRLKRLPVLDDGELVGIVTRSDLAAQAASAARTGSAGRESGGLIDFLESLIGGASLRGGVLAELVRHKQDAEPEPEPKPAEAFSADSLRSLAHAFKIDIRDRREAERLSARRERERRVKALLDQHVSGEMWRTMLEHARVAAANGERDLLMLRFPCALCIDGGRKIDVGEKGWEATLRGEPAELYLRWRNELKPLGFRLAARIDAFDGDGAIGDVGLYLVWGE